MNIAHWLERSAQQCADAPALFHGDQCIADYADFRNRAACLAAALIHQGTSPGDRVAIFMKNTPDYLIVLYGIWYAGAVAVPINAKLHGKEAAWIVTECGARLAFVDAECGAALADASGVACLNIQSPAYAAMTQGGDMSPLSRGADDLAWLFYTSGTTGRPKGVQITHGMLATVSLCYPVDVDPVAPEDAAFYAAPMSHGAGLYAPVHVRMGARHICPASNGFDPAELLQIARDHGPLSMFLAPTMVRRLVDAAKQGGVDGTGIKTIVYGGGPMYRANIEEAVEVLGPRFVQIYGQGECPMGISALSRDDVADRSHPRWRERLGSVGRAQSAVEIAIGDADGRPLPAGSMGEIMVRGAPVMPGYWQNAESTAKTIRGGWLMTGDMGQLDTDGYLTLQDRSKDVIISGGTNIYPREIEDVLLTHPMVHECAVIGRPSAEWGEDIVAFIVPQAGTTVEEAALDALILSELARFKRPKLYRFVPDLPKNNYGKVLKTDLRRSLTEDAQ